MNPWPHQKEAIDYATSRPGGGFLAMGMQTGKTLSCIWSIKKQQAFPAMVITPASVLASWENDLLALGYTEDQVLIFDDRQKGTCAELENLLYSRKPLWILINFEKVVAMDALHIRRRFHFPAGMYVRRPGPSPALNLPDWAAVVVDESIRISNHESVIGEYLLRYPKPENQLRFCLSGSPTSETVMRLAAQFVFMDGHYFGCPDVDQYIIKYWDWDDWAKKYKMKNKDHKQEAREYLQDNAFCRQMKDLGIGAKKLYSIRMLEPNAEQLRLQKWLKTCSMYTMPGKEEMLMEPMVRVTFEHKIASGIHPLDNTVISDVKNKYVVQCCIDRPTDKYLILSAFTAPIHRTAYLLREAGFVVGVITGDTKKTDREQIRRDFQAGTIQHVIAQTATVQMGLSFAALDAIIYLSNMYHEDVRTQSEDRGQHTKRTTPYGVWDLCLRGFGCLKVTKVLTKKIQCSNFYTYMNNEITR